MATAKAPAQNIPPWVSSYDNYEPIGKKTDEYMGLVLLDYMINGKNKFPQPIAVCDMWLKPVIDWLYSKGYVTFNGKCDAYIPSDNGRKVLDRFMQKYGEYLQLYDIFSAVDLTAGEFAFAKYWDFETDEEWKAYLAEERFVDLRIAVAEFKGMDPFEIVFMSFLNECRFDREEKGWKRELLSGEIWQEITKICQTAWKVVDLGYGKGATKVTGESVLTDVIKQGTAIAKDLVKAEEKRAQEAAAQAEAEAQAQADAEEEVITVTETTTTTEYIEEPISPYVYGVAYYDPFFYNPYYCSPMWLDPWYW